MNLNYVGSIAQRFMKFRTALTTTEDVSTNLFNAISLYVPKSLASGNLVSGSYDPTAITADAYAILTVTADNYNSIMAGTMLTQWKIAFNDGANVNMIIYIIIFDDTSFTPTLTATTISWAPLTKAFNELYFISAFKTLFSPNYAGGTSDANFFDLSLCLSQLCENDSNFSVFISQVLLTIPSATDSNACKILSKTVAEEEAGASTFESTTAETRASFYWGFLKNASHTWLSVHNGNYLIPVIIARWFDKPNDSGQYIGNKLAKIRLSGSLVKPTGNASPLNSSVNLNLPKTIYELLDAKKTGYFVSIADNSDNDASLISDRTLENVPVTCLLMSRYIDYTASQKMAKLLTDVDTLTKPVLCNKATYERLQSILTDTVATFAGTARISDIQTNFPPFETAKVGNSFVGTAVWSAKYIDDLEAVTITGSINF